MHERNARTGTCPQGEIVYVGLGSNLGDRPAMFRQALAMMAETPGITVTALSRLYYSDPVDGAGPGEFLNAVVELRTTLSPLDLLRVLQRIERHLGRTGKNDHRPRTIDLDLLLHGQRTVSLPGLTIPHPRMYRRAFVMRPLRDLAPGLTPPPGPLTVAQLWRTLDDQAGARPADDLNQADFLPAKPIAKA